MKKLELSIEEFTEKYIRPAVKEVARKYFAGESLTAFEQSLIDGVRKKRFKMTDAH